MPELHDVVEALGLDGGAVNRVAVFAASRARRALFFEERPHDLSEDEQALGGRIAYVTDHGFRAFGMVALFNQREAVHLGEQMISFLHEHGHISWPLAYATAALRAPSTRTDNSMADQLERLAAQLSREPDGAPRELARCLLPPHLQHPDHAGLHRRWNDELPAPRWRRASLGQYGIDLELLRAVVSGRTTDAQPLQVSEISMPALVRTLFRSIEEALLDARRDGYHWRSGLSLIQPTDPEVLIAIRACLRSEAAAPATRELPADLPMTRALVGLVNELDSGLWT